VPEFPVPLTEAGSDAMLDAAGGHGAAKLEGVNPQVQFLTTASTPPFLLLWISAPLRVVSILKVFQALNPSAVAGDRVKDGRNSPEREREHFLQKRPGS
jgi:hypothetical protein